MSISGGKLAGGNPKNGRVENDFYATNPKAVTMLMDAYKPFQNLDILEPSVGQGHIAKILKETYPSNRIDCMDIVDRGYPGTVISDFLTTTINKKYDCVITNPPFSLAQEFIEKSMTVLKPNGIVCMFLKIQFLEGVKRKEFFEKYPPKYVYVFRQRMATWNNGQELDPNGKRWATTMCHAWFVWENGFNGEPTIRWL